MFSNGNSIIHSTVYAIAAHRELNPGVLEEVRGKALDRARGVRRSREILGTPSVVFFPSLRKQGPASTVAAMGTRRCPKNINRNRTFGVRRAFGTGIDALELTCGSLGFALEVWPATLLVAGHFLWAPASPLSTVPARRPPPRLEEAQRSRIRCPLRPPGTHARGCRQRAQRRRRRQSQRQLQRATVAFSCARAMRLILAPYVVIGSAAHPLVLRRLALWKHVPGVS
jgi:hypothetical protein